jgi:hypothetical protein
MAKSKVDAVELSQMLRAGKTVKECAKHFGVTSGAISQQKKILNINVVKAVVLESAHEVVARSLDTLDQLRKINESANELLDLCMKWINGDEEAIQVLESQVRTIRVGKNEVPVSEYKFKDPREIALKAMSEIRGQLKLQLEMFQTFRDMETVQGFQFEVLQAIEEVDSDVRNRIIERLQTQSIIRRAVRFD